MKLLPCKNSNSPKLQEHTSDIRVKFRLVSHGIKILPYIGCHRSYPDVEFLHQYTIKLHTCMQRINIYNNSHR